MPLSEKEGESLKSQSAVLTHDEHSQGLMHTAFQLINHRTLYVSFRECHLSGRPWLLTLSQTTASLHGTVHMHDLCTQWAGSYTVRKTEQFVTLVTISWGGMHLYIRTTAATSHLLKSQNVPGTGFISPRRKKWSWQSAQSRREPTPA